MDWEKDKNEYNLDLPQPYFLFECILLLGSPLIFPFDFVSLFFGKLAFIRVFGCLYDAGGKAHKFSFHRKVDGRKVPVLNTS